VFVGYTPDGSRWGAFKELPNTYFLGRRELSDLPGYLKGFDVCLMPYLMVDKIFVGDSLKMYEYLAAGKPIVSMPLPSISQLGRAIAFAQDANEWCIAIKNALNENSHEVVEQRQAIARENTWDQRATLISKLIAEELKSKARDNEYGV
jgi:glycosyltransferase involved in cell wall biosynthesis